jgi:hypothetical protein
MIDINSAFNKTKIDYKILLLIFSSVALLHLYLENTFSHDDLENFVISLLIPAAFVTGCVSITVAKAHGTSKFAVAFYSLAVGYFCASIGEILYYYFDLVNMDPFPSIADVFFFIIYPTTMIHLIINIRFYQVKSTLKSKIAMIFFASTIILLYVYFSYESFQSLNVEFFYGLIFVSGAACIASVGLYGAIVVRKIPLGRSWFLLVTGIVIGTLADVWYYVLEFMHTYTLNHIVIEFWLASYLIIIYSLYKHYKIM